MENKGIIFNIQKFSIGPQFIFGKGSTQEIGNLSIKKAYIICDPFMEKSEMVNKIVDVLKKSGAELEQLYFLKAVH